MRDKKPEALRLAECLERDCKMNWPDYDNQMSAASELRRLHAENKALQAVAERYRWLRDKSEPPHNFYIGVPVEFHGVRYQPHEVDAYIDAAIAAAKKEAGHE